jgi:hypothetical protein
MCKLACRLQTFSISLLNTLVWLKRIIKYHIIRYHSC